MRKLVCLLTVLMMCVCMVMPAYAAEGEFVPSITYKPSPEIVPVEGEDGKEYIGCIRDKNGEIIDYVGHGCILITPIAHVWDEEIEVPADVERLLTFVYEALNANEMEIPYDKHDADLDPASMVIRDLFDVRWACDEHSAMIEEEGVVFEITFDLGVVIDAQIFAMTYDEEANEWSPIAKTVNNGDGTVTCTFEHLCAIEFSMPIAADDVPVDDAQTPDVMLWIILLVIAVLIGVCIVIVKNKKKNAE